MKQKPKVNNIAFHIQILDDYFTMTKVKILEERERKSYLVFVESECEQFIAMESELFSPKRSLRKVKDFLGIDS